MEEGIKIHPKYKNIMEQSKLCLNKYLWDNVYNNAINAARFQSKKFQVYSNVNQLYIYIYLLFFPI